MTIVLPAWVPILVIGAICGAALWRGGTEERVVSTVLLLNIAISVLLLDVSWPHVQLGGFLVDTLTLAIFVAVALRTPKYWPMCAAAFQLLAVMTHVAKFVDRDLQQWAYLTASVIWTYLLLAAIGVGAWNAARARRQPDRGAAARAGATRR